jgi:hypothetical protein
MSIKGALTDIGRSIIGSPQKALLIIYKGSTGDKKPTEGELFRKTEAALAAVAANSGRKAVSAELGSDFHVLQVQYNPSSIRFVAHADQMNVQLMMKNLENEVPNQMVAPPRIVMSVDLIFDAVNLKDSFMFEKLRFSVGDEFSMVAALLKERGYTVQPQTNGIIAAMLREGTRQVTFKWADMSFTGYLQEASARYTMFSVSGKPVRSMVRINITQYVPRLAEGKYWNDAFDKLFGDASTSKVSGGKGFGSDYQNLVNLSF